MHLVGTHEGRIIFKDSVSTKDIKSVILNGEVIYGSS